MTIDGKDVSSHQGMNYSTSGDEFLFAKATEGRSYVNPFHDRQVADARKKGLVVGHYHVIREGGRVKEQAAFFIKHAKPKKGDILVCDWEQWYNAQGRPLAATTNAQKNAFIAEVKRLAPGHKVMLYCNRSWWQSSDRKAGDGLWLAEYGVSKPAVNDWLIWQYTDDPIDKNKAKFASKAAMKKWAEGGKVEDAVEDVSDVAKSVPTADGVALDLSDVVLGMQGPVNFRGRKTCSCVTRVVAMAEARMKAAGIIKNCVDFFQLGYNRGGVVASAGTHDGGGAMDVAQFSEKATRIWRECGVAFWERGRDYGFDPHGHGIVIGCPHVSSGAASQVTQYKNGRNGLADHGPDKGPDVEYITWQKAWKKYVKETAAEKAADEPVEEGVLGMTKRVSWRNSKDQKITKENAYQWLRISDKYAVSVVEGPTKFLGKLNIVASGLGEGDSLYVLVGTYDVKGSKSKKVATEHAIRIPGVKSGWVSVSVPLDAYLGKAEKDQDKKALRIRVKSNKKGAVIRTVDISGWKDE